MKRSAQIVRPAIPLLNVDWNLASKQMRHRVSTLKRIRLATPNQVVCPKCLWKCARPSKRRTPIDLLAAVCLLRPFRCRSCRSRYYRLSISG
jgi:hypothetical protein